MGTIHSPWRFREPAQPRSSTRSAADVTIAPGLGRSPTSPSSSLRVHAKETRDERCSNSSMLISPSATALCSRRIVPLRSASETRNATMSPPVSVMAHSREFWHGFNGELRLPPATYRC
ncbi:Uncharacterised protein [Mycobacterium tuberculosis]|uniref:Uncharacterized protein n=1 Tax=Mycobacterium tuberculosis TaxID=1773 RepID=A0A654U509_MYCTX|nr:Uncharacterised protein [Mycobacterium tuberculosis]